MRRQKQEKEYETLFLVLPYEIHITISTYNISIILSTLHFGTDKVKDSPSHDHERRSNPQFNGPPGRGPGEEQENSTLPPNAIAAERTAMGFKARSQAKPNLKVAVKDRSKKSELQKKVAESVWRDDDFKENAGVVLKDEGDDRKTPDYEILYKQDVGSEDVFLNLGDRDGSSDHCSDLVLKVKLPGAQLSDITLDVLENRVVVSSKNYHLNAALPQPVRKDDGNAKWDKLKGTLSVTLPIKQKSNTSQT